MSLCLASTIVTAIILLTFYKFSYFQQLIVMNFVLDKPYYPYFFTRIITTFSQLFPNFYSYFFPAFLLQGT